MANVLTIFIEEAKNKTETDQLTSIAYIEGILHYKINSGLSIIGLKMDSICYYATIEKGCIWNKWVKGDSDKKCQKILRKIFPIKIRQPDLFFILPNPFLFEIKKVRNKNLYDFGGPPTT